MKKYKFKNLLLCIFGIVSTYYTFTFHTENKKYLIINEILNDIDFKPQKIYYLKSTVTYNSELLNNFSLYDKPSIFCQLIIQNTRQILNTNCEWKANKLFYKKEGIYPKITKEDQSDFENVTDSVLHFSSYSSFSFPILSTDNKTAILNIEIHEGMCSGNGAIFVLKKINGKWKIVKKIDCWIS